MKTVFFGANPSIVKYAYSDIINNPNIDYCDFYNLDKSFIRKFLFRRKTQDSLLKISNNLSKLIYRYLLKYKFLKHMKRFDDDILFMFVCQYQYYFLTSFFSFISFLKKQFPKAKFVFYFNDIIESCYPEALPKLLKEFDLVLTFDKQEAIKYGMEYYGEVYSKNCVIKNDFDIAPFDVFYVGSDRGRLDMILSVFDRCLKLKKKCRFYIFDVLPSNMDKIAFFIKSHYGSQTSEDGSEYDIMGSYLSINKYCPYPKTLTLINQCKCLVEIVLPGQNAGSLRVCESIAYKRKLLTNCVSIKDREFYNPRNICIFANADEISQDFFENAYEYSTDFDFSPTRLIEYAIDRCRRSE